MRYFKITLLIFGLLLISCNHNGDKRHSDTYIFNLKNYFEQEAAALQKQSIKVERTVSIDGKVSTVTDTAPDWQNEFAIFKSLDISSPYKAGNCQSDSVINENNKHLLYENISDKGKVRTIHIILNKANRPVLIEVKTAEDTYFNKEELTYSYQPALAIGIIGTRKSLWSKTMDFEVLSELVGK